MSFEFIGSKTICLCGEKTVFEAIDIFKHTDLPYKKAKKLVTGCNKTCCRKPLMRLFDMVSFGEIDYFEIDYLINKMQGGLDESNDDE